MTLKLSPISATNIKEDSSKTYPDKNIPKKNLLEIHFNADELNILMDEVQGSNERDDSIKFLTQKRKRKKFTTIKNIQEKEKYIHYKKRKILLPNNKKLKISLMTYNILNQICMKKLNRPDLNLDDRMNKIKKEILSLNPDIFCLQEADTFIYQNYLMQDDMQQYEILYGTNCGSSFINIIAFKKNKFKLKSFRNFSLLFLGKASGNRGMMGIDLELIENNNNNNNELIENNDSKIFSVYNVHFPWKFENDRVLMLNMLFEYIKDNNNINNVFILGDFNSEPASRIIKLFYYNKIKNDKNNFYIKKLKTKKSSFDLRTLKLSKCIYNNFRFKSAYQSYSKTKEIKGDLMRHPAFTSRTKFFKRTIDYIFFSKSIQINKILKLPLYFDVDRDKYLPSKEYPSDHLKLFAEFSL